MTTIPGLFAVGESNFSDHGANRLGASSLMQCSGDGYFILPYTITDYLATEIKTPKIKTDSLEFEVAEKEVSDRVKKLLSINGNETPTSYHRRLGKIMWDYCGMVRNEEGLKKALVLIKELEDEFWKNLKVAGKAEELNQELEKAGRVMDFFELAKLLCTDALNRKESCGAHFREESQTETGEAKRDDDNFSYVAAWEYKGQGQEPELHKEELKFEYVKLQERSYK
jgi:succinate dehydrogenase / fumarate reductase flavoprotein subunit